MFPKLQISRFLRLLFPSFPLSFWYVAEAWKLTAWGITAVMCCLPPLHTALHTLAQATLTWRGRLHPHLEMRIWGVAGVSGLSPHTDGIQQGQDTDSLPRGSTMHGLNQCNTVVIYNSPWPEILVVLDFPRFTQGLSSSFADDSHNISVFLPKTFIVWGSIFIHKDLAKHSLRTLSGQKEMFHTCSFPKWCSCSR